MPVTLPATQPETEAMKFVNQVLKNIPVPSGSTVLEVGCGEGQHARLLVEEGYDVTGIDASAKAIATAKNFEMDRLHFFVHDIRLPFHINYFDVAFNLFSGLGHYRTEREHYNAIRSIAHSIKHEGWLIMDADNKEQVEKRDRLTLGDFNDLFAFHGLQVQDVYGDYAFNMYDVKRSPRLILLARKK